MEPNHIQTGTLITYRLKWYGIPYRWVTRIEKWEEGVSFVDTQLVGPYILWHHTHTFESVTGGVLMRDVVQYRLPFGPMGSLMRLIWVRRQLEGIFNYRLRRIAELLSDGVVMINPPTMLKS